MSDLLLAPHADDETLFASFLVQRYKPIVVVVIDDGREHGGELLAALVAQDVREYRELKFPPGFDRSMLKTWLHDFVEERGWPERVFAPWPEPEGHEDHNEVGVAAIEYFGRDLVTSYLTYAPRGERSRGGMLSEPEHPEHVRQKLIALGCYRSQILNERTRPWFYDLLDMREWVAV
jgi:LmbE family N-acetylglucosaminyl deacetylase